MPLIAIAKILYNPSLLTLLAANCLHILRQPADALAVPLPHDHRAHEDLNWPDAIKRDLALSSCTDSLASPFATVSAYSAGADLLV